MTFHALPTFLPDIQEPYSNLADVVFRAADGSPIGRGATPWRANDYFAGLAGNETVWSRIGDYWTGVFVGATGFWLLRKGRKAWQRREGTWTCTRFATHKGKRRCVQKNWRANTRANTRF